MHSAAILTTIVSRFPCEDPGLTDEGLYAVPGWGLVRELDRSRVYLHINNGWIAVSFGVATEPYLSCGIPRSL